MIEINSILRKIKYLSAPRRVLMHFVGIFNSVVFFIILNKLGKKNNFFFVQVGANNGKDSDIIFNFVKKYKWSGLLIEPLNDLFDELLLNYKGYEGLIFENIAISSREEIRKIYRIKNNLDQKNKWYRGLGSFFPEVIAKHKDFIINFDEHYDSQEVKCLPLSILIKKYDIKKINLLAIDTEGYDFEILKNFNFSLIKPDMILYEHKHLKKDEQFACFDLLRRNGYKILKMVDDTFAYLNY